MDIKAAAKAYNADYPEAAAEIDAGTEVIHVFVGNDPSGWMVHVVATAGVVYNGGFIAAGDPIASNWMRCPRWAAKDTSKLAHWWARKHFRANIDAGTPIDYKQR